MSNKKFIPLNGNLLIKRTETIKTVEEDGLILGEARVDNSIPEGEVIETDFESVEKGDEVVFSPHGAYNFILNGEMYVITNQNSILGKFVKTE